MKQLQFTIIIFALFISATCYSQTIKGSRNYITQEVTVDNFDKIRVNGSPDVRFTQRSGAPSVEFYGSDNIVPLLEAFVQNGTLIVQFKKNAKFQNPGELEVRVTAPTLKGVEVIGSGDIDLHNGINTTGDFNVYVRGSGDIEGNNINCQKLTIRVDGSGDISLDNVTANSTEVNIKGSGDVELTGSSRTASFYVDGSGDIDADKFEVDDLKAEVKGSGDISCWATRTLSGSVRGSGEVGYRGNPEINFSKKGLRRL